MTESDTLTHACSFCGQPRHAVQHLLTGPNGVFICDACITLCYTICKLPKLLGRLPHDLGRHCHKTWAGPLNGAPTASHGPADRRNVDGLAQVLWQFVQCWPTANGKTRSSCVA